jgi:hypothetical protein
MNRLDSMLQPDRFELEEAARHHSGEILADALDGLAHWIDVQCHRMSMHEESPGGAAAAGKSHRLAH